MRRFEICTIDKGYRIRRSRRQGTRTRWHDDNYVSDDDTPIRKQRLFEKAKLEDGHSWHVESSAWRYRQRDNATHGQSEVSIWEK